MYCLRILAFHSTPSLSPTGNTAVTCVPDDGALHCRHSPQVCATFKIMSGVVLGVMLVAAMVFLMCSAQACHHCMWIFLGSA